MSYRCGRCPDLCGCVGAGWNADSIHVGECACSNAPSLTCGTCIVIQLTLSMSNCSSGECPAQAAPKVWRYGNSQRHLPHMDIDKNTVAATVIMFLSDSGMCICNGLSCYCSGRVYWSLGHHHRHFSTPHLWRVSRRCMRYHRTDPRHRTQLLHSRSRIRGNLTAPFL